MLDDDPSLRRDRRSTSNDYRSTRTDWSSSPRRLVFPRRETLPYVYPFFLFVHSLINRVTTSLPTSLDPPYLSPLLTRPKLLDPSPPRRRSSPPSGLSESPEPTRGTLESELLELTSSDSRKRLQRSDLALFIRSGLGYESCVYYARFSHGRLQKNWNFPLHPGLVPYLPCLSP